MDTFKSAVVAFVVCLLSIYLLRPLAVQIGLVDRPNQRKHHLNEIPLIGGISIFFGFCLSLLTLHISLFPYRGLLAGASVLVFIGVLDDFHNISSRVRLVGQMIASLLLVIWSHALVADMGNLFFLGDITLGLWAIPISVLFIMANINAMNMVDGQDGLAGTVALTQTVWLGSLCYIFHRHNDFHLLIIFAILLCGFLLFNLRLPWRKQASVFLGDAGSTMVAFVLAWFAIRLSQVNPVVLRTIVILWIMSFPIFDLFNVVIYRARKGQSIFQAGRDHIHHVLHLSGISAGLSTLILACFSLVLGGIGLMLNYLQVSEGWQFVLWVILLTSYLLMVYISRNKYEPK